MWGVNTVETCTNCNVVAQHVFTPLGKYDFVKGQGRTLLPTPFLESRCLSCDFLAFWKTEDQRMDLPENAVNLPRVRVYPDSLQGPDPAVDMPADCREVYEEARAVRAKSPRAAVALLRLVVERLMPHLGQQSGNLNAAIGALVASGLPPEIQMALDACRVIGNDAVHPGEIRLADEPGVAEELMGLVNFIVEDRISRPKAVRSLYEKIPDSKKAQINVRDTKAPGS